MGRSGKPVIFILGASQMQLPAISIAKSLGWTVIVADANREAPGATLADYFEHVDLKDLEGMTSAAKRHRDIRGLDGVFTAGTDFSATVSWVANQLCLPGIPYETALDASDKVRMRSVLEQAGLSSPRYTSITRDDIHAADLGTLKPPFVIKPVDSMGSRGVRRADSQKELEGAVIDALEISASGRVIVEEYIDGPELSLDALVHSGEVHICGVADRHIFFPPYFVEMGHTMPSSLPGKELLRVTDLFISGIRAIGITTGAAKGDIKLSSSGPVIGEIAARLSGGYMSGWTYPYSSGVRITEAAMRIAVGLSPGPLEPTKKLTSAERAFVSIPGVIESMDPIREEQGVSDIFFRVKPGDRVIFPSNNTEKCGNVITVDSDRDKAVEQAEKTCRMVFLRLEPWDRETEGFIFGNTQSWVPDAFSLTVTDNIEAYNTMPPYFASLSAALESRKVAAIPLLDRETSREWHGEKISSAFRKVLDISRFESAPVRKEADPIPAIGRLFWKAFLRGGVQGGVWVLDSLSRLESKEVPGREVVGWLN